MSLALSSYICRLGFAPVEAGYLFWLLDILGQFYFTGTGSAIFDNCRKLSRRYEIEFKKL